MGSDIAQDAIFIGANKQSYVADYSSTEHLVAYGAANNVALWKPLGTKGVYHTLKKHTKEVTGVKFIPGTNYVVSVSEDSDICVWKQENDQYVLEQTLEEHQESITCLAVIDDKVFVTGGADGKILVWGFFGAKFVLFHQFEVKFNFYPLTLALQNIDNNNYVLAVGGTTSSVYIYTFTAAENTIENFRSSAVLNGHEDWIKCLSFTTETPNHNYILASGSQDRYIRLWRLKLNEDIDDSDEDSSKLVLLSNKQYKFPYGTSSRAAFNFEALIMGHDDWVTGLQWSPIGGQRQLLSSSADTALMVWEMDQDSGIWCCVNRLGEMSIKGASTATGASGGFWSCLWIVDHSSPFKNQYILANGKTGSFRVYRSKNEDSKTFESVLGVTGPTKDVTDLVWAQNGEYFVATSLDQTARLFAPWKNIESSSTWHEFARPQIHGYDMICLDNINGSKYVSGGDEKVLRVFEITHSISKLLKNVCGIEVAPEEGELLPESASLPVLGLSNKAANEQLEAGEAAQQQQDAEENGTPEVTEKDDVLQELSSPPLEDHLQRYTLFPEIEKLYGHGYEITCCATSATGLIASACRSNSAKHAVVRVFDSRNEFQQQPQVLEGHNLTITSMEFSLDGKYLVAVSRDRQLSVWAVGEDQKFELVELNTKAHSRIVWDCSWGPQTEQGHFFVTGSRDKQIKLWNVSDERKLQLVATAKLAEPVTSVSSYKTQLIGNQLVTAVGTESGAILLYGADLTQEQPEFHEISQFSDSITPSGKVIKLAFSSKTDNNLLLGVASADTSVRLYSIDKSVIV